MATTTEGTISGVISIIRTKPMPGNGMRTITSAASEPMLTASTTTQSAISKLSTVASIHCGSLK